MIVTPWLGYLDGVEVYIIYYAVLLSDFIFCNKVFLPISFLEYLA